MVTWGWYGDTNGYRYGDMGIAEILEKFGDFCWMFPKSSEISLMFVGRNGRKQYIYNVRPPSCKLIYKPQ